MMKRERIRLSIMQKIALAILLTSLMVIGAICFFLTVSLRDYYVRVKRSGFSDIMSSVGTLVENKGMIGAQSELFKLAGKNRICIEIIGEDNSAMTVEGLPYTCYVHQHTDKEDSFINEARKQQNRFSIHDIKDSDNKTDYFVGTLHGKTEQGYGYVAIVTQTLESVTETVSVVLNQLVYVSVVLIVIAIGLSFCVAQSMTKSIRKLTQAARRIADGSLGVTVEVRSNDEIGDLADNFNYMSKEISKVNVLQKELVANISHDIRTPLTMIRGYAEMIKDITGNDKEAREEQLDIIIDESNRLSTLVSDVMDLSLMQAGQSPLNLTTFSLTTKAKDILSRFQLLKQTQGFEFVLDAKEDFMVYADEVRIEQVFYNLINNAVNHIGEIKRITLHIERIESEIRAEVEDTGKGISQEDLPLIWDRYYKPYQKEQKAMGTGLGLSIVKAILVNHHSRFGVISQLGVGSRFWFTLKEAPSKKKTEKTEK